MNDWNIQLKNEFEKAQQARVNKNEGQARVCARRAAGIAARAYLTRKGIQVPNMSAYDLLNLLRENLELPPEMQSIADHLTMRVNEDFQLPVAVDLVAEVRILCDWLMAEN
jgi:HEPN domain-containing protein